MISCDVAILGGGPAGSTCARRLVQAGVNVLVVDRRTFPRDKVCAGWVTPPVLECLGVDPAEYSVGRVCQPIEGFLTGLIGGEEVVTQYGQPVSYGIRRFEFDHYLLERSGAALRLDENVRSIERRDGRWVINESIETPLLIGAGGHFCPVARRLGNREGEELSVVTAQEIEFEIPEAQRAACRVDPRVPELFFCNDLAGYGWCFRKGNWLNIGLGRVNSSRVAEDVAAFVEFLRQRGRLGCDVPERMHGHAYRLWERERPKLVDDGVLLIGDSAGLAYPQSGEGIRPAVESGLLAAETILAAKGDFSLPGLDGYREKIESRFGPPRNRAAAAWLPAGWLHFAARKLMASRWFTRRYVLDQWFLHAAEAPLTVS
jgi:menaquinone-9 beta-reductase